MSNKIVPSTYRAIIDDVMLNIRHEFDEYGVDESVLADLQQRWESKVIASNVADFDNGAPSIPPLAPPPMYQQPPQLPHYPTYQPPPHMQQHPYPQMPPSNGVQVKSEPIDPRFSLTMPPQYALPMHGQPANGQNVLILPRNVPAGVPHHTHGRYATPAAVPEIPPLPSLPQLDGPASDDDEEGSSPPSGSASLPRSAHPSLPPPIPPLPIIGGIPPLPVLDSGPSSSNSAMPPLPNFNGAPPVTSSTSPSSIPPLPNLSGTVAGEEINSDLDDSDSDVGDDADETGGPDTDIVFCTYDKVQRVKSKWKCVLKDGMVHVNGRDYLFARCNCEFEW